MSASNPTPREFAALMYALALARGKLSSLETGEIDLVDLKHISRGTSLASIAAALGVKELDLAVDWSDHLTQAEMDKIAGRE